MSIYKKSWNPFTTEKRAFLKIHIKRENNTLPPSPHSTGKITNIHKDNNFDINNEFLSNKNWSNAF